MVFCAKYGEENLDNADFCKSCGTGLRTKTTSQSYVRGFSKSVLPSLIVGVIIIMVGLSYTLGRDFGQTVGGWGESFGESVGSWGKNFGESMGAWGERIGRTFADLGTRFASSFGASILILIGVLIVTSQLRRYPP